MSCPQAAAAQCRWSMARNRCRSAGAASERQQWGMFPSTWCGHGGRRSSSFSQHTETEHRCAPAAVPGWMCATCNLLLATCCIECRGLLGFFFCGGTCMRHVRPPSPGWRGGNPGAAAFRLQGAPPRCRAVPPGLACQAPPGQQEQQDALGRREFVQAYAAAGSRFWGCEHRNAVLALAS